jgi:hypothetical protein
MTSIFTSIAAMTPKPKIVAFTLSNRTGYLDGGQFNSVAGFYTAQQTFNSWLRTQQGILYNGLVDLGADPYLGDSATCPNTLYFVDGLHQTIFTNYSIIAPLWEAAIEVRARPLTG